MATKRALLIGVGNYHNGYWQTQERNACIKDVGRIQQLLQKKFAFAENNIQVLCNESATKANILAKLQQLVADTQRDDVAVIAFSGHGFQFKRDNKLSGYSETIVPYDADYNYATHISDTEMKTILFSFKSVNLTVILDSCYSGGATRGGNEVC